MPVHDKPTSRLDDRYYVKVHWRGQAIWAAVEQSGIFRRIIGAYTALLADAFTYDELEFVKIAMKGMFHGALFEIMTCTNEMLTNKQLQMINVRKPDEHS